MTPALRSYQPWWKFLVGILLGLPLVTPPCLGLSLPPAGEPVRSTTQSTTMPPSFTTQPVELPLAQGKAISFAIKACKVYTLTETRGTPTAWTLLFQPRPYLLPQQCVREHLEFDGKYIHVEIGTQALGAGGCCTTYAAYRSQDGKNWEVRRSTSAKKWQVLATPK